jgi:NitT/TauT family transport system substrate-binding protein
LTLAGTAGLLGRRPRPVVAEPPPETTTLRPAHTPAICLAPNYVAEVLLQAEGFTDVPYVKTASDAEMAKALTAGHLDFALYAASHAAFRLDAGDPFLLLGGLHVGCYELRCVRVSKPIIALHRRDTNHVMSWPISTGCWFLWPDSAAQQ